MLISKTATLRWNSRIKKHYEDLGYLYTKMKDEFEVNVEDLTKGSHVMVTVQCDNCGETLNIYWQDYLKCVKKDGKYYCKNCAMKLYGGENLSKSLLKNGKSFEQWCIENNKQDILDRWDYDLNNKKPNEISFGTKVKIFFKCPKGIHESELKKINMFTSGQEGSLNCKACNSFAQWGIDNLGEDFLKKYWDYNKNTLDPWRVDKCSAIYVWIKCQEKDYHGSTRILISAFNSMSVRCSYCGNLNVHHLDSLGYLYPEVINVWSNKNKKSPYDFKPNADKKVYWKCPNGKHKDYLRSIGGSKNCNFRCPECSKEQEESSLQEKTRLYLTELGYDVLHENKCSLMPKNKIEHISIKRKGRLKYDNEIVVNDKHLMIEVNGQQHYYITTWHKKFAEKYGTTPEYELEYQQRKDNYKKDYAISKGYLFLELPYWVFDEKDTYKNLIDNITKDLKVVS